MAKLIVEVLDARDLLPTNDQGSASPFVEVDFDGRSQRTQTKTRDLYPTWNEKLVFDILNPRNLHSSIIQVILYDSRCANRHKDVLGCVQISGASVPLSESEASVHRHPLCKRGFFSHGRGDISLRIYTVRAQYYGNQQPRRHLITNKATGIKEISDNDYNKYKGGDNKMEEDNETTRNSSSAGTSSGIIPHQNLTNTTSSVYFSPTLYYLRVGVGKACHLAPFQKNQNTRFHVLLRLGNQSRVTRTSMLLDGNHVWNEEIILIASEPLDDFLSINVEFREGGRIGWTVLPVSSIPQRFDSTAHVQAQWFNLNGISSNEGGNEKKQGKILLKLCLDADYHVFDSVSHHGDFQPSAKLLTKDNIGSVELGILGAQDLVPYGKQRYGGTSTTDAYCVAKYGNKWVRTRTVINTREPCWNEQYTWEVYDPCTVITIGVFHNGNVNGSKKDTKDTMIGRIFIPIQTLEINRMHTHCYPLFAIHPSGLKNHGELQVAVRFTAGLTWFNMISLYTKPLFPKIHYLQPLDTMQLDMLRHAAGQRVVSCLSKAEPPLKREVVEYMLGYGSYLWSMRKHRANFDRLMSFVLGITTVCRWFDEIRHWKNPLKTVFIHALYLVFVWYPSLILPTFFLFLSMIGMWNYRFRPRHPPQMDVHLSRAEKTDLDFLDEEFDTFPTSQPTDIVKMRYDRLRSIMGRYQTVVGDISSQGERVRAILTCTDWKATSIFTMMAFICVVFIYMASFRVVAALFGLYWLRHPRLRSTMPSLLVNLFLRLPTKRDMLL